MKRFLFWPTNWVPWLAGLVAFAFLSLVGFQKLPLIEQFAPAADNQTPPRMVAILVLVVVLNSVLFWSHVRPHFLTIGGTRGPWLFTFIAISLAYLLLYWWLLQPVTGVQASLLTLTFISQIGVYVTLAASQLWAVAKPALDPVRENRETALRLFVSCRGGDRLSRPEKAALDAALDYLATKAAAVIPSLRNPNDVDTLKRWIDAAKKMATHITPFNPQDLGPGDCNAVASSFEQLRNDT
jgi:hypothetical protein